MEKAGRIQVLQSRSAFGPRHYENNKLGVAEKPNAEHEVFDYNNVNYQDFWQQTDRRYEDAAERIALRRLTKTMQGSCLEIGCGFGRLVDEYAPRCSQVLLTDCTAHLIEAARQRVDSLGLTNVECRQLDLYKLEECGRRFDNAICVRVMHHVEDVPAFFRQVNGALAPGGQFVFEYANKRNLLEIGRWLLRRPNVQPFGYQPSRRGRGVFYNFNPAYIKAELRQAGFEPEEVLAVSMFRSQALKRVFGWRLLAGLERWLQRPLAWLLPAPSMFVRARKVSRPEND